MRDFWQNLPRPFFALAPLDDVTDAAFRHLIAECGKPDVMFTEFTSADGIARLFRDVGSTLAPEFKKHRLARKLLFSPQERPIVAQLFSAIPGEMETAARVVKDLGFDGIDINMGCPDRAVEKAGCGAALMKNPQLARELIIAAKTAGLPVSVKTRIGYRADELSTWLPELMKTGLSAITIHARTRKELSDVPARWEAVAKAVGIRNSIDPTVPIIGNGDVKNIADAKRRSAESGCDGVMLGRAIFGNPWLFSNSQEFQNRENAQVRKRVFDALTRHIQLFDELLGDKVAFAVMKKHFKAYVSGFDGAREFRAKLMETNSADDAMRRIHSRTQEVEREGLL